MSMKEISEMSKIDYEDLYQDNKIVLKKIIVDQFYDIQTHMEDILLANNIDELNESQYKLLSIIDRFKNNIMNYNI